MSNTSFALSLKEELALISTYIWHTKRDESRLRRKLSSIELKIEESRRQLRDVLKFMKQHQNGIDVHLKKLSKTENTLREEIDNIFNEIPNKSPTTVNFESSNVNKSHNNSVIGIKTKQKQTKRAKKLNNDLIEIVQHRNDHESRLDSSYCTFKLISSLLNDETKPININNFNNNNLELDDNISPLISEYIYYRNEITKIQKELVECVEKRELANQSQYDIKYLLYKQIPKKCIKCDCKCKNIEIELINDINIDIDIEDEDNNNINEEPIKINKEILKNELIKLGQDIHQRSGLIKQQTRDNICHLRVFVGSELITWMVKSNIVNTRYKAQILSSLLIDGGYIYCAYKKPLLKISKKKNITISNKKKIITLNTKNPNPNPSIVLSSQSQSSLLTITPPTPNKLLLPTITPPTPNNNNNNNNNNNYDDAPSSVISIASSLSVASSSTISTFSNISSSSSLSIISSTPYTIYTPSSIGSIISSSSISNNRTVPTIDNNNNCKCLCKYCKISNKLINLSFNDTNDLYRFRCDDSRIERISKMGWLEKFGRFRSKKRHYIWDGVRKQLREYKTKGDIVPLYKYPFNNYTQIKSSKNDECALSIIFDKQLQLKLKASTMRERDSWIRVLKNNNNNENNIENDNNELINNNNNDKNYEEYRHLRMTNRLKWSTLFISVKSTSIFIKTFREFILKQNKLERCHKTQIEVELNKLFTNNESPICILFNSFTRLFLEPFYKININQLEIESIDSIISLCVDDLSSFIQISQNRLINLLLPNNLRNNNTKIYKLFIKLIKKYIYTYCFNSSIYNTIFPLYQRIHHNIDQKLYEISMNSIHLTTKNYQISKELQIDVHYQNNNNNNDSILQLDSSKVNINQLLNTSKTTTSTTSTNIIKSPFQPCIDKLWEMSYCHTPTKKLQCLVELQQLLIKSIDNYRQKQLPLINNDDSTDDDDDDDDDDDYEEEKKEKDNINENEDNEDGISIESLDYISDEEEYSENNNNKIQNNRRTHGIVIEDDNDINVSLISYESATSEYWTQSLKNTTNKKTKNKQMKIKNKNKNKKCKQLLIASDDMIPLFCYTLVQSQIQSVHAEIAFMNDFMNEEEKQMKAGFYLTTLQAATSALLNKKLPLR